MYSKIDVGDKSKRCKVRYREYCIRDIDSVEIASGKGQRLQIE